MALILVVTHVLYVRHPHFGITVYQWLLAVPFGN